MHAAQKVTLEKKTGHYYYKEMGHRDIFTLLDQQCLLALQQEDAEDKADVGQRMTALRTCVCHHRRT